MSGNPPLDRTKLEAFWGVEGVEDSFVIQGNEKRLVAVKIGFEDPGKPAKEGGGWNRAWKCPSVLLNRCGRAGNQSKSHH